MFAFCIPDYADYRVVMVLLALLYPKRLSKGYVFFQNYEARTYKHTTFGHLLYITCYIATHIILYMQGCDVDVNKEIYRKTEAIYSIHFYHRQTGKWKFITCEQGILTESKSLQDSFYDLVATYYVCNIAYPKALSRFFLQASIFNLKDRQAVPPLSTS